MKLFFIMTTIFSIVSQAQLLRQGTEQTTGRMTIANVSKESGCIQGWYYYTGNNC